MGTEVDATVTGLDYSRRYDLVTQDPSDGTVYGVEVKTTISGTFRLDPSQVLFDASVVEFGANSSAGPISGVMYRGVCFGCTAQAAFSSLNLLIYLKTANIPHSSRITALPGGG